jgi:hypothetical protein
MKLFACSLIDRLEPRCHFVVYDVIPPRVDLRADVDRDNAITVKDNDRETAWTPGRTGRGSTVLPNLDKDNTNTAAPDNWTGGNWNGKHVGVNNVIDNDADLRDITRLRLLRLINVDSSYWYDVTLKLVRPDNDPAWLKDTLPQDRVRVFMPSREVSGGRVLLQAGDSAILGPGLGDTIVFKNDPAAPNEFPLSAIKGDGFLELGVEGIKLGAAVRFELTVAYRPVLSFNTVAQSTQGFEPFEQESQIMTDSLLMRVAPFTLADNRQRVSKARGSVFIDIFEENKQFRSVMRDVFGDRLIEGRTGDIWQQDGCEIGYVASAQGTMPVVLELPRSRGEGFEGTGIRAFLRKRLLQAGVGVSTEVAGFSNNNSSAYGGDIESLPNLKDPSAPPYLLRSSAMPTYLKNFFAAQNANPVLELNPDSWLAVGHVDEIVHLSSNGKSVVMADAELGYALLLWAHQLNPKAKMQAGMGASSQLPTYTEAEGVSVADVLRNGRLRRLNLEKVMDGKNLPASQRTIARALGLSGEVFTPRARDTNVSTAGLNRAGVFTQLLADPKVQRTFEVRFTGAQTYTLRYRDTDGAWSTTFTGRRDRDEIFGTARAYLLKRFWTGAPGSVGDRITFRTNPDATLLKAPTLFINSNTFTDFGDQPTPPNFEQEALRFPVVAFTSNFVNSLSDGPTVITPYSYGPRVRFDAARKRDIFDAYATQLFASAGYTDVRFVDARFYHNASGGVHCGTNVFRNVFA